MRVLRCSSVVVLLVALTSLAGCAKSHHDRDLRGAWADYEPTLKQVAKAYTQTCVGGDRESNNCAHFLSDAFIRAGYTELLDSPLVTQRCKGGAGRVVRAQDMLKWFQSKSKRFHSGRLEPNTGYWAIYQEKPGRHHVAIIDSSTGKFYGTADCKNWPVQWNYQW
ncbi:MAG: hypothetical protein L3K26_07260 [Candidatus Hydrogenedentes bacterium]|nr:hypothetical protein [Candidatus Hydrogenedentota bacterium]